MLKKIVLLTLTVSFIFSCNQGFLNKEDIDKEEIVQEDSRGNFFNGKPRWSSSHKHNLTYRFTTELSTKHLSDSDVRTAFREAANVWMNAADVTFKEVSNGELLKVFKTNGYHANDAKSAAPASCSRPYSSGRLQLYSNPNNNYLEVYNYDEMVDLFLHELGHFLGLAHEHQRNEHKDQHGQGIYGTPYGDYDKESIMHYDDKSGDYLSPGDVEAVTHLYGKSKLDGPKVLTGNFYKYNNKDEIVIVGNTGISLYYCAGSKTFLKQLKVRHYTWVGSWFFNGNTDKVVGVADFDGNGSDDIFLRSPWGIGFLKNTATNWNNKNLASFGMSQAYGQFDFSDSNLKIQAIGDFNNDGKSDFVAINNWGIGIFTTNNGQLVELKAYPYGTWFKSWNFYKGQEIVGAGDFDGYDGDEILIKSDWGFGALKFNGTSIYSITQKKYGQWHNQWTMENYHTVSAIGELDGTKGDEIIFRSDRQIVLFNIKNGYFNYITKKQFPNDKDAESLEIRVGNINDDNKLEILTQNKRSNPTGYGGHYSYMTIYELNNKSLSEHNWSRFDYDEKLADSPIFNWDGDNNNEVITNTFRTLHVREFDKSYGFKELKTQIF